MAQLFVNNFSTTVGSTFSSGATTLVLTSGTGVPLVTGSDYWLLTIEEGANREIVKVTACTAGATSLTVTRQQEGTTSPASFSTSAKVEGRLTAGTMTQIPQIVASAATYMAFWTAAGLITGQSWFYADSANKRVTWDNLSSMTTQVEPGLIKVTKSIVGVGQYWEYSGGARIDVNLASSYASIVGYTNNVVYLGANYLNNVTLEVNGGFTLNYAQGMGIPSGTPTSTTNKIYQVSGVFFWNGLRIATIKPVEQTTASSATVTPNADTDDIVTVTAQAAAITLANPTGSPVQGQKLIIRLKDNGTARAISFGTQYRAMGNALPTTTILSKTLYLGLIYNSTDTKWDLVALAQEV